MYYTAAWSELLACALNQVFFCIGPDRAIAERVADAEEGKPLLVGSIKDRHVIGAGKIWAGKVSPLARVMLKVASKITKALPSMGSLDHRGLC